MEEIQGNPRKTKGNWIQSRGTLSSWLYLSHRVFLPAGFNEASNLCWRDEYWALVFVLNDTIHVLLLDSLREGMAPLFRTVQ